MACQASTQEELDQLLSRADAALYQAKENGRDRIECDLQGLVAARSVSAATSDSGP